MWIENAPEIPSPWLLTEALLLADCGSSAKASAFNVVCERVWGRGVPSRSQTTARQDLSPRANRVPKVPFVVLGQLAKRVVHLSFEFEKCEIGKWRYGSGRGTGPRYCRSRMLIGRQTNHVVLWHQFLLNLGPAGADVTTPEIMRARQRPAPL